MIGSNAIIEDSAEVIDCYVAPGLKIRNQAKYQGQILDN
jgi:hypothetical protein